MPISFFSPIHTGSNQSPKERCRFLRGSVQLFNFGQKAYQIHHFDSRSLKAIEIPGKKPGWVGVALRVIAIATVVIPLIMLLATLVYRALNHFQVLQLPNPLNQIPDDVLKLIAKQCGLACLRLGATNKDINRILEAEQTVKEHKTIIRALKEVQEWIRPEYDDIGGLCLFAKAFAFVNKAKALEFAKKASAITSINNPIDAIKITRETLQNLDREEDKKFLLRLFDNQRNGSNDFGDSLSALLAEYLAPIDQDKAVKCLSIAMESVNRIRSIDPLLKNIAMAFTHLDADHTTLALNRMRVSIEEMNYLNEKIQVLILMAEASCHSLPERGLELVKQAVNEAKASGNNAPKAQAYAAYAKIMISENEEKALRKAESAHATAHLIASNTERVKALIKLSEIYVDRDSSKASHLIKEAIRAVDDEVNNYNKADMIDIIIQSVKLLPFETASELIDFCYGIVNNMLMSKYKSQALAALALACAKADSKKAADFLTEAISENNTDFSSVAKTIACLDKEHAVLIAKKAFVEVNTLLDGGNLHGGQRFYLEYSLGEIAEAIAPMDLELALEGIRRMPSVFKAKAIAKIIVSYSSGS